MQLGQNFLMTTNELSEAYREFYPKENFTSAPDVLFRIGVKEDFELRVGAIYTISEELKYADTDETEDLSGLNRFFIGFRQKLFDQKGILPATGLQFTTDFGGVDEYKNELPNAIFRLNFANKIGSKLNLNWNFISSWNMDQSNILGFYIFSFSYPLSSSFAVTAEVFGDIDETTKFNGGVGLAYLLNDHFQFDLYGSYGRNELQRGNVENELTVINGGISYRIVNRKE